MKRTEINGMARQNSINKVQTSRATGIEDRRPKARTTPRGKEATMPATATTKVTSIPPQSRVSTGSNWKSVASAPLITAQITTPQPMNEKDLEMLCNCFPRKPRSERRASVSKANPMNNIAEILSMDVSEYPPVSKISDIKGKIVNIKRPDQQGYNDTIECVDDPRGVAYLLQHSEKRMFIDSFAQHMSAALNLPSTVCWITTSPTVFGYDIHDDVFANPLKKDFVTTESTYSQFELNESIIDFPLISILYPIFFNILNSVFKCLGSIFFTLTLPFVIAATHK